MAGYAYQLLVWKITRLEIPIGAPLTEKNLMAEFGIGRTPIREALQRLAAEGLICHLPHRGMFVCELIEEEVRDIYEFRSIIDGPMARLAALRATEEDVRELTAVRNDLVAARKQDDVEGYIALDRRFYDVLARCSGNKLIADMVPSIYNLHLWLWFIIAEHVGGWHGLARSHEEMTKTIVSALSRGQPDEAELAVKVYIAQRHEEIRELLQERIKERATG
jgi:DNA-binding GntR family transcriptional regulator